MSIEKPRTKSRIIRLSQPARNNYVRAHGQRHSVRRTSPRRRARAVCRRGLAVASRRLRTRAAHPFDAPAVRRSWRSTVTSDRVRFRHRRRRQHSTRTSRSLVVAQPRRREGIARLLIAEVFRQHGSRAPRLARRARLRALLRHVSASPVRRIPPLPRIGLKRCASPTSSSQFRRGSSQCLRRRGRIGRKYSTVVVVIIDSLGRPSPANCDFDGRVTRVAAAAGVQGVA